jgi:hypothetical protein
MVQEPLTYKCINIQIIILICYFFPTGCIEDTTDNEITVPAALAEFAALDEEYTKLFDHVETGKTK